MPTTKAGPEDYQVGGLYYLTWDFGGGRGEQAKFSIVLAHDHESGQVLHCWPTRTHREDLSLRLAPGCNNQAAYPCFLIRKGQNVTSAGFSFKFDTHIYHASNIWSTSASVLDVHRSSGKLRLEGILRQDLMQQLVDCILESDDVLIKYQNAVRRSWR